MPDGSDAPPKRLRSARIDRLARIFGMEPDDPVVLEVTRWSREQDAAGWPDLLPKDDSEPD